MATVTLEYDARNKVFEKLIEALIALGAKRTDDNKKRKCAVDESLDDIKAGKVTTYKSSEELFKKLGI